MNYKLLISILGLFSAININAQENPTRENNTPPSEKKLYVKGNALLIPIGVINAGVEYQLNSKYTLQADVLISPWKSFAGHEFQYYSTSFEGRYYFNEAFKGFYLGANISAASFVLQKWNYWGDEVYDEPRSPVSGKYLKSQLYQKGFSLLVGITAGYQFKLSDQWRMDIYGTVGNSQDFYKGYARGTGERYDEAKKYNKSGEILPYRGGIMISYQLK